MFAEMSDRDFVDFLSALWEDRGWETAVTEDDPGVFMVTGDREDGQRGLMLVVPDPDSEVPGERVQSVAGICDAKNVDVGVVATRGTFTDDAERIASANGVHLLDTEELAETVEEEGLTDLVAEFRDDGGSYLAGLPLPGLPSLRSPSPISIPTRGLGRLLAVVAVVAIAAGGAQTLGVLPPVPGDLPALGVELGADTGDEFTVTAVSLTTGNESAIEVAWDARAQSVVSTNGGNRYEAPDGQQFVVVQMNVTNHRDQRVIVRPEHLGFAANGTRVAPRRLEGAVGQPPVPVEANGTASMWVVFVVPKGADAGTLLGLPGPDVPPMEFHRNRGLAFGVGRG